MTNAEAIKILLNEWKCIDRNDGINCNRKCESCDLVMDSAVLKDAYNLAIKALEAKENLQPTCNQLATDVISRQALCEYALNQKDKSVTPNDIMRFPSSQPEPQWIPVSERLPKVAHSVLFSRRSMDTSEGCLQADGKWWQYRWNEILNADQVIAWMPLPEPYRAERRTDDGD